MATGTSIVRHDPAARLAAFNRVSTDSVDDAADAVGRIFCPHELKPTVRSSPDFFALHNSAVFGGFSVNYVAYGGAGSIDPRRPQPFFLLPIPPPRSAGVPTAARGTAHPPPTPAPPFFPPLSTPATP